MGVCILSKKTKQEFFESLVEAYQQAFGQKPNKVDAQFTARTEYYKWVLLNKIKGEIEITCPETWDTDYFLDTFLLEGKICITDTTAGVMPLQCGVFGLNAFQRPTSVNIANPVLGSFTRNIDQDCVLMYLFDNRFFRSFVPVIDIFAQRLANCDSSIDVNLLNTKVAYVFDCVDEKQAKEAKLIYDKITSGEPAVFYHSTSGMNISDKMNFFTNNVKNVYIADLVQAEKRAIYNEFLTQIGINNAAEEKRERLLVDEVNSNNDELMINMNYCYENIKKCVEKVNKMFPDVNLSIKLPFFDRLEERSKQVELNRLNGNMGDKEQQRQSDGNAETR